MKVDVFLAFENAAWPVLLLDLGGVIRWANPAAAQIFGSLLQEDFTPLAAIWSPGYETKADQFLARLDGAASGTFPLKFRVKDLTFGNYSTSICPLTQDGQKHFIFQLFPHVPAPVPAAPASAPVAATAEATEAASQRQKLALAMQLTRTIAMDFNNALTTILGHNSLILNRIGADSPWRASLLEIEKAAEKAAEVSYGLASFSRQEKDTRKQAEGNLNDLIRRTVEPFKTPANAGVIWQLNLEPRLSSAQFDETKIQQALMKILENAVQAIGSNGCINVVSLNRHITDPVMDSTVALPLGRFVCVEISDTGCGIPEAVLPHIIEPFFTTKPGHRGLGLAWAYGIITNHGGTLAVTSEPNKGTSVRVYLPSKKNIVTDKALQDEELHGTETILIVDDEDLLLTMGQMVLSAYGYRVLTANSGQKALEIFANLGSQIDLVVSDLVMPNMSGHELNKRLRALAPTLRIIRQSANFHSTDEDNATYLQKPYTSLNLLRKVKLVLSS